MGFFGMLGDAAKKWVEIKALDSGSNILISKRCRFEPLLVSTEIRKEISKYIEILYLENNAKPYTVEEIALVKLALYSEIYREDDSVYCQLLKGIRRIIETREVDIREELMHLAQTTAAILDGNKPAMQTEVLQPKVDFHKVGGLAASAVDFVIKDQGVSALLAGSLLLDKEYRPMFCSGKPKVEGNIIAAVAIGELEEAGIFKTLAHTDMRDISLFEPLVDQLVYAALRKFKEQLSQKAENNEVKPGGLVLQPLNKPDDEKERSQATSETKIKVVKIDGERATILCPKCSEKIGVEYRKVQTYACYNCGYVFKVSPDQITMPTAETETYINKKWTLYSKTKILKNNRTGMEYPAGRYEYQNSGMVRGYQILHGPDVWVNDSDVDLV